MVVEEVLQGVAVSPSASQVTEWAASVLVMVLKVVLQGAAVSSSASRVIDSSSCLQLGRDLTET